MEKTDLTADLPEVPLAYGARTRPSPFFESTLHHGVGAFSVYNHMMMPDYIEGVVEDYWNLVEGVSIWDVGCERQVEITGPDAAAFTQYLVTRDVERIDPGSARYTLVCRDDGGILNDPVLLRLAEGHFWLSLADSDLLLWAMGVSHHSGYDVALREPDVSPLQVQGPRSLELMQRVFGDLVDNLGFYRFVETTLDGVPLVVARTGWSGEVGFEVFLRDGSRGGWLWDRVFSAGEGLGVKLGAPNNVRRIEAGLMSYGTDMDASTNPWEVGLDKFVDLDGEDEFIGRRALADVAANGPRRRRIGLVISGEPIGQGPIRWWKVTRNGDDAGFVTSAVWSPGLARNIAYALVSAEFADEERFEVSTPVGPRAARRSPIPFVAPRYR
ncbi:MAG: glycine cleavage T C-terminal barrel domain-containing protein [Acidimicrobiia bacterium]|jgi:aminomethyltransferase